MAFVNAAANVGFGVSYPQTIPVPGRVTVCKKVGSPPGSYNFTTTSLGTFATDQLVSSFTLTAGSCKVIFIRKSSQPIPATITIAETAASGFLLTGIQRINSSGKVLLAAGFVVAVDNAGPLDGTIFTFVNVSGP